MQYKKIIFTAFIGFCSLAGCKEESKTDTSQQKEISRANQTDCMWRDAVGSKSHTGEDLMNFAFPDTNVSYWSSQFSIPEGAKVYVDGEYPYSRHFSLVSYTAEGERVNSLPDAEIVPNKGSTNPFIVGNKRLDSKRSYSAEIKLGDLPFLPEANTLYAPKTETNEAAVLYRMYVPNEGRDIKGDVSFPRFRVVLNSGKEITGTDVCSVLKVKDEQIANKNVFPVNTLLTAFNNEEKVKQQGFPAQPEPTWYTAYNGNSNARCIYKIGLEQCEGLSPERKLNLWATPDNEYVFSVISRQIGKVAVLKGKLPTIASTYNNESVLSRSDIRYWSVCTNELVTTATNYCLYDGHIKKVAPNGEYTVVVSLPDDRPSNATDECGNYFLPLSPRGTGYMDALDNVEKQRHADIGLLIMRNLLPAEGFNQAIQNTRTWGEEKSIMGDYLPTVTYTTQEEFEKTEGCKP